MGNQNSRLERRLGSTASQDPRLTTVTEWLPPEQDHPHQRQYPLPVVSSCSDGGRIKLRKHSSPLVSYSAAAAATTTYSTIRSTSRRPLFRVFPFRPFKNSNSSSSISDTPALSPSSSVLAISSDIPTSSTSLHPLILPPQQQSSFYDNGVYPSPSSTITNSDKTSSNSPHTLPQDPFIIIDSDSLIHSNDTISINGRKFHTCPGSSYILPCDEEEIDRLHLLHFMVRFAIQGNYLAPVADSLRKGAQVLDIGCGPGSWAMEIAGEYPKSTIVGIDMTNLFPRDIKPYNCHFYQCNALKGIPFQDATFDYVFMRFMSQGIEVQQWDPLLKDIIRVLKPGGWLEVVEVDLELHRAGPTTKLYNNHLISLMTQRDLDPHSGRQLKERIGNRDELVNVNSTFISCPGGQWAGKLGRLTIQSWKSYYQALGPQICMASGMTVDEYNEKLETCWDEADEYKTFENVHFAYAQKRLA